MTKAQDTKKTILEYAKSEFLKEGFVGASMREIAKQAGLTTGAIYRYYADKEALFREIVAPVADRFYHRFASMQEEFAERPAELQADAMVNSPSEWPTELLDEIYDNADVFKLIVCHSEGTEYAGYVDRLVDVETKNTRRFIMTLKNVGMKINMVSESLNHILASAYFKAVFETVAHDMPKEDAVQYVGDLTRFYAAGWNTLLGL